MATKKDKNPVHPTVLLTVSEKVRIVDYDKVNVMVERYEPVFNSREKTETDKWVLKGYYRTILGALRSIVKNDLLVDKDSLSGLESYLGQMHKVQEDIFKIIERERKSKKLLDR